jgi:hypothetical protein
MDCPQTARMPACAVALATSSSIEVHVVEGRHAAADEFGAGDGGAQPDELARGELPLDGPHITLKPDVEAQVVGDAAQQGHGDVRVRVDQPGHQNFALAVDGFPPSGVFVFDLVLRSHREDAVTSDGKRAGQVLREILIHGEDVGVEKEGICLLGHLFSGNLCVGATIAGRPYIVLRHKIQKYLEGFQILPRNRYLV